MRGTPNANNDKVPTAITYDHDGKPFQWGHMANLDDARCLRWFKLLLEPQRYKGSQNTEEIQRSQELLKDLNKNVDNVISDYLRLVWNYALDHIARRYDANVEAFQRAFKLSVILTVPAIWTPESQTRTLKAAKLAGITGDIQLVAEPEAAALAVLREKTQFKAVGPSYLRTWSLMFGSKLVIHS